MCGDPQALIGQKNWFPGIFRLSKWPDLENYNICESKNCNFRVLRGIFVGNSKIKSCLKLKSVRTGDIFEPF